MFSNTACAHVPQPYSLEYLKMTANIRKILLFFILLTPQMLHAQVKENFTDSNFYENPVWAGDDSLLFVNSSRQLQTKKTSVAQAVHLATKSNFSLNSRWEFYIRMTFNPSVSNQARVYLLSDRANLEGSLNGYYVHIGEDGNDDSFGLYKQTGANSTLLIRGKPGRASGDTISARIRVECDKTGRWSLFSDTTGGTTFSLEGSAIDSLSAIPSFFGVYCKYTITRSNRFFFDDILVEMLEPDTLGPKLISATATGPYNVNLLFDEPVDSTSASQTKNYFLSGNIENPAKAEKDKLNSKLIHLTFETSFVDRENYSLAVDSVKDLYGNTITMNKSISFTYKSFFKKLIITELLADPFPQVDLPPFEFVELYNRTDYTIPLKGMSYSDASTSFTFSKDSILPNEYLIICSEKADSSLSVLGKTLAISPFPSLNNSGDILTLRDQYGNLVDKVSYRDSWYKNLDKKSGGYSLELINLNSLCDGISNWSASKDTVGGTPGKQNSLFEEKDTLAFALKKVSTPDSTTVLLEFTKPVDSLSAVNQANYRITGIPGKEIPFSVQLISPEYFSLKITLKETIKLGVAHFIHIENLLSCSGTTLEKTSKKFILPFNIHPRDILINELLFNPNPGGADFVEVYNNSEKVFDLSTLKLASANEHDSITYFKTVSDEHYLLMPEEYLVLTSDAATIKQDYFTTNPDHFLQMSSLPNYNDDNGRVVLLRDSIRIDQFNYDEDMHFSLIDDPEGVSLERVSFTKTTNDRSNWHSASSTSGYATPAYRNSQATEVEESFEQEISFNSEVFSPDNDGRDDYLELNYKFSQPGTMANISIYNEQGKLIRQLVKNDLLGQAGTYVWDGTDEQKQKASAGIYIICFETFDLKGYVKRVKKPCVLAEKL